MNYKINIQKPWAGGSEIKPCIKDLLNKLLTEIEEEAKSTKEKYDFAISDDRILESIVELSKMIILEKIAGKIDRILDVVNE